MGAASRLSSCVQCSFFSLLLCSWFVHPSQAAFEHCGYDEEKVPLSFIVPADPTPALSPLAAATPPVAGADDDDNNGVRPRLPTERRRRGRGCGGEERRYARAPALAPSLAGPAPAPAPVDDSADAPAPCSGSGAPFIESSPAVPVPRGVRDTATILPMPAPGVVRHDVGRATLVRPGMVPALVVGFILSSWRL